MAVEGSSLRLLSWNPHAQALIGNSQWSSRTSAGPKLYHVGTIPNAKVG